VRALLRWTAILWLLVAADAIAVMLRTIAAASANLMPGNIFVSWFVDGKFLAALGSEVTSCCFNAGSIGCTQRTFAAADVFNNQHRTPLA
jgi:uncharacterized membrane protein